jgi:Rrf2 family cysteine metabolism transcriptional repressor
LCFFSEYISRIFEKRCSNPIGAKVSERHEALYPCPICPAHDAAARPERAWADGRSLAVIAETTGISRRYLEQLAMDLRGASLIRGKSGRRGGYELAKPASAIRLGEIVEAAIGPINIVDCVLEPEICIKGEFCECRTIYRLINQRITEVLNEFSLATWRVRGGSRACAGNWTPSRDAKAHGRAAGGESWRKR